MKIRTHNFSFFFSLLLFPPSSSWTETVLLSCSNANCSKWISVKVSKCWQRQRKTWELPVRRPSAAPFYPRSCKETVCSLSACFRIMELCHILFKVRLIRGDSEPLICCHNADVFILSVTMALLCVGLPRAHCTQGWLVNQGPDSGGETWHTTKARVRLDRVKPVT